MQKFKNLEIKSDNMIKEKLCPSEMRTHEAFGKSLSERFPSCRKNWNLIAMLNKLQKG